MEHIRIKGRTRTLGLDQGYQPLHVRDEMDGGYVKMVMAWTPSPEDMITLNNGGQVVFELMGSIPPPMKVRTGYEK